MVARNHQYQRAVLTNSSNLITSFFFGMHADVSEFISLRKINQDLVQQNNELLHKVDFSFYKTDIDEIEHNDSLFLQQFSYVNARIVNSSINRRNNFLTINKGRRHGIQPDMGVITANGVIGIVTNVSNNFSTVISLLHRDTRISVRMKKNDHLGTLQWDGRNYKEATVLYIPTHVDMNVGDSIITSGFSVIFPAGIHIGHISEFIARPGEDYFTARVELAQDFNNLTYVHVIKSLLRDELLELEALPTNRR
jgi:rod shape-determining protein MreC